MLKLKSATNPLSPHSFLHTYICFVAVYYLSNLGIYYYDRL